MVSSSSTRLENLETDTWLKASWEGFMVLAIAIVVEALQRSHTEDDGVVTANL